MDYRVRRRAAMCSPIAMQGRLVLALGMTGMIEASITLNPSMPSTRHSGSTTVRGSWGSPSGMCECGPLSSNPR